MELRHLRYFCAVAEYKSFTAAARRLNVSQSGVSGQIRDLEREIGVSLLRRSQREVALTPEGVVFWDEAREILLRTDRAVELAQRTSQGRIGKLTIGLCGPVTASFLPKIMRRFRRQSPGVALSLRDRAPAGQIDALLNGEIDLGFTRSIRPEMRQSVASELLLREPVVAVLPKGHKLAEQPAIAVTALVSSPVVLYGREGAPEVFDAIVSMCKKAKFSPKIADAPQSWQSVLTMVEAGEGVGLVPECVQHLRANEVVFRPLRGGCRVDAIVVWRRNDPNIILDKFLALIRAHRDV